jgi:hypothetical protein
MNIRDKIDKKFDDRYSGMALVELYTKQDVDGTLEDIKQFIHTAICEVLSEVVPEEIEYEWIPNDEYYENKGVEPVEKPAWFEDFMVCSKCGEGKDYPEAHPCDVSNDYRDQILNNIKSIGYEGYFSKNKKDTVGR